MFTMKECKIETITPAMAEEMLSWNYARQRKLKPLWLESLCRIHNQGLFRTGLIGIAILNGVSIVVNGQHQLTMVSKTKKPIKAMVERFSVDGMHDISTLFRQYDSQSSSRSISCQIAVEAAELELDWAYKTAPLLVGALVFNQGGRQGSASEKVDALQLHIKEGEFVNSILAGGENGSASVHLQRRAVVAAMLRTYEKSQKESAVFWAAVRDGDGLKRVDPEFRLREFLRTFGVNTGRGASNPRRATDHEICSKCITAWNAFRKNESTVLKYFADKPIPAAK